ncbi:NAD(P)-binding protein [Actinoplanes sp. NPDC051513]|uniref:NAD(P)-binding protein n=1 Tax=Actinoplanes sp. NPDC051513 TaxID=3363908 RepID=UPI003795C06B
MHRGAGIAGLATADAFARLGADVVVYERPDAVTTRVAARVQAWQPPRLEPKR